MKTIEINNCGDSSVLKLAERDIPKPNSNQVLIKTIATSVNPIDTKERTKIFTDRQMPLILHTDVSGFIEQLGDGVSNFKVGDAVFGCCGHWGGGSGALAEYQTVDADTIALAPPNIPLNESASFPLVGITAWEMLNEKINPEKNKKVLVQSATGGAGFITSQMALAMGMEVYGITSNDEKLNQLQQMGITACNRKKQDQFEWAEQQGGFDLVINTVGGKSLDDAFVLCNDYGTIVGIAGRTEHNLANMHWKNQTLKFELMITTIINDERRKNVSHIMSKICKWIEAGKITPNIAEKQFDLNTVGQAHDYLTSGQHNGKKIIINIGNPDEK